MKRKKRPILNADVDIIWSKLKDTFEEHGALNTFTAMLTGIRDTKYEDLTIGQICDTLFNSRNGIMEYLDEYEIEGIKWEIEQYGNYEFFKIENMTQEIRFEAFMEEIRTNPCQLRLIA